MEENEMITVFSILLKEKMTPGYKAEILYDVQVPANVLNLWIQRGFEPIDTGVANVVYPGSDKKYTFPAFFKVKVDEKKR
jgi:hypothetical protein